MEDGNQEQRFEEYYDPERNDPEAAKYYLLDREIWSIRFRQGKREAAQAQKDFEAAFNEIFNEQFSELEADEIPRPEISFLPTTGLPTLEDDEPILRSRILLTGIPVPHRKAIRLLFLRIRDILYRLLGATSVSQSNDTLCRAAQPASWGGGGPGGLPFPQLQNVKPGDYRFKLPDNLLHNGGDGVDVVILDTAPKPDEWNTAVDNFPNHPLIQSLGKVPVSGAIPNNAKFAIIDDYLGVATEMAIANDLRTRGLTSYPMVDHGLFIAGIIRSIAPQASIRLYRVLCDDGAGRRSIVENAIQDITKPAADEAIINPNNKKSLIFNCSLNIILRNAEDYNNRNQCGDVEDEWAEPQGDLDSITIVGAAGNEGRYATRLKPPHPHDLKPPRPRYPAGFNRILGVTGLTEDDERASYANWAEDYDVNNDAQPPNPYAFPPGVGEVNGQNRVGIATMGGDVFPVGHVTVTNPFDSILGIYTTYDGLPGSAYQVLHKHPGWARWSGTSFANAIVTGVLALIASHPQTPGYPSSSQAQLVTELLKYCEPEADRLTTLDENGDPLLCEYVLKVTQGT
jgi:hypothetical protein